MLTDEELTTRLAVALRDSVPEMTYAGRVPQVRRRGGGLAAASVVAAATTVALVPAALDHAKSPSPGASPSSPPGARTATPPHRVLHTLDFAGLRLTYAEVVGERGLLYFVVGPDLGLPAGAEKVDVDTPGNLDVWFVDDSAAGEPQLYARSPDSSMLFGLYGEGWTREQLIFLLEHPTAAQRGQD